MLGSYTQELQPGLSVAEPSDEAGKRLDEVLGTVGQFEQFSYSISPLKSTARP